MGRPPVPAGERPVRRAVMLRSFGVQALTRADVPAALDVCARDAVTNVFVAARLHEGILGNGAAVYAIADETDGFRSLLWASSNVIPVGVSADDIPRYAARLKRARNRYSSFFGPAEETLGLWKLLASSMPTPRSYRPEQPLMVATDTARTASGVQPDPRVRVASLADLDAVVPAAAAMFTEEIGYRPYAGSDANYRRSVAGLIGARRTFVWTENGEVVFKADVGSLAHDVAQIQGVWIAPAWRGQGLAAPCMAATVDQIQRELAPTVSLYVNSYNTPALRSYLTAGFEQQGTFATIIL